MKLYVLFFILVGIFAACHSAQEFSDTIIRDKITQTFVIGVYCDPIATAHYFGDTLFQDFCEQIFTIEQAIEIVKQYNIGGIIFLGKSTYAAQKEAMNRLNQASQNPLLYMQDFECGLGMRLIDREKIPFACALEKETVEMVESYAKTIAREMQQLGVHINLAPVCDVRYENSNITHLRSFSSDPYIVSALALAFSNGLQKNNIAACAKHFPGHGPTTDDSHYGLPIIKKSIAQLEEHDLVPFKKVIENSIPLIMTGHLLIPAGDETYPVSLSRFWIHEYLRGKLGYQGIIITDALNMKALDRWELGEKELLALQAGNDLLLCPGKDLQPVVEYILQQAVNNYFSVDELDQKIERIQKLKNMLVYSDF